MFVLLLIIVIIVLFVLWRDAAKLAEDNSRIWYDKGYSAGYWDLADRLTTRLSNNDERLDSAALNEELGLPTQTTDGQNDEQLSQPQPDIASTTMAQSADFADVAQAIQKDTQSQSVRNLNVLLFVASLLFVAAGAAFISAAMPDAIKLLGIWVLVAAFYAAGLFLQDSEKLHPAGVAFAGTGLGLLPFAGLALNQLANIPGEAAWAITSMVGVVAYYYAAIVMKSQTVGYLTLAFVLSFAASLGNVVALPMVWSFVAIISAGLIINLVAYLWPNWIPDVFRKPIEASEQAVVPLTIVASLFFTEELSVRSYELLIGVSLAYYAVVWLQTKAVLYRHIVRGLAQILVLLVVWDLSLESETAFGIGLAGTALVQQIISLLLYRKESTQASWVWIGIMQSLMLVAPLFWTKATYNTELLALDYLLLGAMSLAATFQFRQALATIPGIFVSLLLPFIVGRSVLDPPLSWEVLASWFVFGAGMLLLGRYLTKRPQTSQSAVLLDASVVAYLAIGSFIALAVDAALAAIILLAAAAVFWIGSYVAKRMFMSVLGSVGLIFAVYKLCVAADISGNWIALSVLAIAGAILYGAAWYLIMLKDEARATGLLITFWALSFFAIAFSFFDAETKVTAAAGLVLVAGTLGVEGLRRNLHGFIEAGVYIATFGLQRMLGIASDDVSAVFYAHWWAATIFAVGQWFGKGSVTRTIVALAFITASSGIYALAEGGVYQVLFLAEHVAILLGGALLDRRWALWWGLIGSVLAVLWFLKDVLFLAFAFLGLVVIGVVMWRLKTASETR